MDWRMLAAIVGVGSLLITTIVLQRSTKDLSLSQRIAYAMFPGSQLLTAVILYEWIITLELSGSMTLLVTVIVSACCPIDVLLFPKLKEAQDKEFAETRVRMLAEQLEVQERYNDRLAEDAKNIDRIRSNAKREFERAAALLSENGAQDARSVLAGVREMMGTTMYRFCKNAIIDVIADVKHADCEDAGVRAEFSLDVPRYTPAIPDVELCAVFSNLLDNASEAAKASAEDASIEDPFVVMVSEVHGNILSISVRNSMPKDAEVVAKRARNSKPLSFKSIEDHGWGLSIVEEIVLRHGGALTTKAEGGVFQTSVILLFEEAESTGAHAA